MSFDQDAFDRGFDEWLEHERERSEFAQLPEEPRCNGCGKIPNELPEYQMIAEAEDYDSPTVACIREEGTYNRSNGHFWCNRCYIAAGMPLGVAP